jgi:hypothetical protein
LSIGQKYKPMVKAKNDASAYKILTGFCVHDTETYKVEL